MLEITELNAGYGGFQVLFDISMKIREGSITVIVGPNGSGKSTLIKSIFGLTTIFDGQIMLGSENIRSLSPHERARKGIAYLPQTENVWANLTVRENLIIAGYTLTKDAANAQAKESLELFPVLKNFLTRKAGTLSGGERQMLAMAMALIRTPRLMLFDEPTGNLSPKLSNEVLAKILELRDNLGVTIILVEQNARRALELGDQAYLFVSGKVAWTGEAKTLLVHPELSHSYLGIPRA